MFYGEFEHSIDDKGRMTIPARFRARLAEGVVISKGIEPCLWLYPKDVWDSLAAEISALPRTKPEAREFRRQVFSSMSEDVPDKLGRVRLPEYLLTYANLDKQAIVIGQFDYCEIWNPEQWRQRQESSYNDPEGRASMFASLGI
jgi:MraZ protein